MIPLREAALMVIFVGILALVSNADFAAARVAEQMAQEAKLNHFAGLVAKCKDTLYHKNWITWQEPHSGTWMATECNTFEMGRMR